MAAFLLGSLATVIVALLVAKFVFRLDLAQTTFHGFLAIYANSGYMGIPLFIVAFGVDADEKPNAGGVCFGRGIFCLFHPLAHIDRKFVGFIGVFIWAGCIVCAGIVIDLIDCHFIGTIDVLRSLAI